MLEYHLETLTNRGEENHFEVFARRLAEREICPNLLPHTGPAGGGDSKVDSETYPVSDTLARGWYCGLGREAANERWAFAFSAKKDWRPKFRSDVAKIAGTGRGYTTAFFITNQFVPDKARASIEDKLQKQHGIDVRILDRTWICDRVFEHHHEELAVEALCIATTVQREVRRGPLDTQREQDLDEVETRFQTALRDGGSAFQIVEDSLTTATLARDLERPRTEVEGRFLRAVRLAKQHGTPHQLLESGYQYAWTTLFWYEDYAAFVKLYEEVEGLAKDSRNARELERLTTLWMALQSAVARGAVDDSSARLAQHTATLTDSLTRLSKEYERPSTALQARTLLLQMRLLTTATDRADPILRELTDVVLKAESLVGFPLEPLVEIVGELGDAFGESAAYDALFETVVETTSRRTGDIATARALLGRGAQQLDADKPYAAIRTLGRALRRLYAHESRRDLIRALYLCANAYERVGLFWAARGTLLVAASVATNDFWSDEIVSPAQRVCYNGVKWIELRLGRLPHVLAWHELDSALESALATKGFNPERTSRGEAAFDARLGILFLKSDLWTLRRLTRLPDVLDALVLYNSAAALLYALGREEALQKEFLEAATRDGTLEEYFTRWRDQSAADELPVTADPCDTRTVTLSSRILGCHFSVDCQNAAPCVDLGESLLGALEALLSTGTTERLIAHEPTFRIEIRGSEFAERPFAFKISEQDGRPQLDIRCAMFHPHQLKLDEQTALKSKMFEAIVQILAHVYFWGESTEQRLAALFDDSHALERSIDFTTSFVTIGNVLGHEPKRVLSAWLRPNDVEYPLAREQEWDAAARRERAANAKIDQPMPNYGKGEPPEELRNPERIVHSKIATVSLIRIPLWDRASWSGTMFVEIPGTKLPPILAPVFKNGEAARQIIKGLRADLGNTDEKEHLRVTIIRGIDRSNPHAYRVVIGSNLLPGIGGDPNSYWVMVSRVNTMTPTTDVNLNRFLDAYRSVGSYLLAAAVWPDDQTEPRPASEVRIHKRELNIRDAWQIGRHDPDTTGIRGDDDPIIPNGVDRAPVLDLLKWIRTVRGS
jgi:tetratricopeptide (TPR) repeat protein